MKNNNTLTGQLKASQINTLKELETYRFRECQQLFVQVLKEDLIAIDAQLAEERDKKRFYLKDKKTTYFQTMFGYLEIERNYYYDRKKEKYVHLLDQYLRFSGQNGFSPMVEEWAMEMAVTGPSYREAVATIEWALGYRLMSHESLRQRIIKAKREVKKAPKRTRRVLFIEVDGLYIKHQRQRKKGQELKFAAIHEGWTKRDGRTRLVHKRHYRHQNKEQSFWEGLEEFLLDTYSYDPRTTSLVINGDGASWITACQDYFEEQAVFTLDRYHVARDINRLFKKHPQEREIKKAFAKYKVDRFLILLTSAQGTLEDPTKEAELEALIEHLMKNKNGLRDYRNVLEERGINTKDMRPMGSAESTMRVLGRRLKHGRAWSPEGVWGMADAMIGRLDGLDFILYPEKEIIPLKKKVLPSVSSYLRQNKQPSKVDESRGNIPYLAGRLGKPITEALKALSGF